MLSILFLSADPSEAARLRLGEEMREIRQRIQLSKERDLIDLHVRTSVRPADISQALLDVKPNIVHFSGHGESEGALLVEDNFRNVLPIQSDAVGALFQLFADEVVCVVLNACYSEAQAEEISKHVRYVIGMKSAIGDESAISFSSGFYQGLGAARTIPDAFKLGCARIALDGLPGSITPSIISADAASQAPDWPVPAANPDSGPLPSERRTAPPAVDKPMNLGFEGPTAGLQPAGWFNSLGFVDFVSTNYDIRVVQRESPTGGYCLLLGNYSAEDGEFGSVMQRCPAGQLAGKKIRLQATIKTRSVEKWAGMWLRADGNTQFNLFFDNMSKRRISGDTPWTRYTIEAALPGEAAWLNYGLVLAGSGFVWADDFSLDLT